MLTIERAGAVSRVTLDRPDVRNAFNPALIEALTAWAREAAGDATLRVAVIGGRGAAFCAGADVAWMRDMRLLDEAGNREDARALAALFEVLAALPVPLVGRLHGAALGGGAGLLAVCDHVVAADDAIVGFTEARIGLLPAVVAPFVARRVGWSATRSLFLTARRIDAAEARRIGIVHDVVAPEALDEGVTRVVDELLAGAPSALRGIKSLLSAIEGGGPGIRDLTTTAIARQRVSPEGQEGLLAFLEKRPPGWAAGSPD
jgi:methylglutaconyl-CoA hydratase